MQTVGTHWDLRRVPLFQGLSADQLGKLDAVLVLKSFQKGAQIIVEGTVGETMFILIQGTVEISKIVTLRLSQEDFAEKPKTLTRLDGKDQPFFGDMAILENSERSATVTAVTDCQMLELSKSDFERVADADPQLGYSVARNLARVLSARLRASNRDVLKLTTALSLALHRRR